MAPSPLVVNNTALLQHIVEEEAIARSPNHLHITPHPRQSTLSSTPILARRLPPLSYLLQIALQECKSSQHSHILSESLATALQTPLDAYPVPPDDRPPPREGSPHDERRQYFSEMKGGQAYEGFQVLRAIEKKNVMLLMEIRTQQFELLLQPVGGSTPLVHAMRLGESHREVQILLTGAFSRRVNDLTDAELSESTPQTKSLLRSIRANLKMAISQGLASSDTSLLASFLQVLVMSEGDKWLISSSHKIALAIRSGPAGKPVESAEKLVDKWVSRELKKSQVAAVGEYTGNAVADLVVLGLWSVVTDAVKGEVIPLYFFARDDRVTKALEERIDELKKAGSYGKVSKLLRKQIEVSLEAMRKRNVGARERVASLKALLDEE